MGETLKCPTDNKLRLWTEEVQRLLSALNPGVTVAIGDFAPKISFLDHYLDSPAHGKAHALQSNDRRDLR